jgi:formylmethanofuran dehydrogenase subunit B
MNLVQHDVTCARCGCVCDDMTVQVADNRIQSIAPGCSIADAWFATLAGADESVPAFIDGRPADFKDAAEHAASLLRTSKAPLIWGLSRSSTEGQRAAVSLGEQIGATVDTTASVGHAPSIMAVQACGESTSSLGEVRNRSDLVIYWSSDPVTTHPRHIERFVDSTGLFVPNGRSGRRVIVIDSQRTPTSSVADQFLHIREGSDFEVLWTLRALVQGVPVDVSEVGGIPVSTWQSLANQLSGCRYGAVFFGVRLAETLTGHANIEGLLRLVTDLNAKTRFVARRMRVAGDVTGADSVLCWQTGYPFGVSLNRGYPRYGPGEFTAETVLSNGEADCVVLVGAERVNRLSERAQRSLAALPVIVLDPPNADFGLSPVVRFHTAIYGVHRSGTSYRMDEVPIPLRQIIDSALPSDDEVLREIGHRITHVESARHAAE